jgi:hypothetical protein
MTAVSTPRNPWDTRSPRCVGAGVGWNDGLLGPGVNSTSPVTGLSGLRDLGNSTTLAQLPAVASLLTAIGYSSCDIKFLLTKADV